MPTFNPWEVWYAAVRFEDSAVVKDRPVVITSDGEAFVLALKVTSTAPREGYYGEYALKEWAHAGLKHQSTVRVSKKLQLPQSSMRRRIGKLHPSDVLAIQNLIDNME